MTKLIVAALAAGIAIASPIATYAASTAVTAGASTAGSMKSGATTAPVAANAAASTSMLSDKSSFSDVAGSLTSSATAKLDLSKVAASTNVKFVKLSSLSGYKAGMKMSITDMATMKNIDAKVMANTALSAKLKAAGYTPNDVVVVSIDATGNLTVFVNK